MKLRERLADLEHDRWARWQKYLHSKCERNLDGSLTIPAGYVKQLTRQIETPYPRLSEAELDSDRREADRTLAVILGD